MDTVEFISLSGEELTTGATIVVLAPGSDSRKLMSINTEETVLVAPLMTLLFHRALKSVCTQGIARVITTLQMLALEIEKGEMRNTLKVVVPDIWEDI